jgi:hypothetical protein
MPRLIVFVACERVAYDASGHNATIINILEGIQVSAPSTDEQKPHQVTIDGGGSIPMRWVIFTLWKRMANEESKTFVQSCRLVLPSGKVSLDGAVEFTMATSVHKVVMNIIHFPVAEAGEYVLQLFLREKEEKDAAYITDYPIVVTHNPVKVATT